MPGHSYAHRVLKSLSDRGVVPTIRLVWAERSFDVQHGTDTAGIVDLCDLRIESSDVGDGGRYEATNPYVFRHLLQHLPVQDFECRTFVDLGCGKGRALMLAAELGFGRIVGVEFSAELVDVCRQNIRQFQTLTRTRSAIEVVLSDAIDYDIPPVASVFFMYNPFGATVMAEVIAKLRASQRRSPRPIWIVYENAAQDRVLVDEGFLVVYRQAVNALRIYRPSGSAIYSMDASTVDPSDI